MCNLSPKNHIFFYTQPLFTGASNSSDSDSDIEETESDDISSGPQSVSISSATSAQSSGEKYFFGQPVYLTVSGQLHLEVMTGSVSIKCFVSVFRFFPFMIAKSTCVVSGSLSLIKIWI